MNWTLTLELIAACVLASAAATGGVLLWLRRQRHLDYPNERSSHDSPTPRGGGLAVVPVLLFAWAIIIFLGMAPFATAGALVGAGALAYVGWRDDRHGTGIGLRLAVQAGAVVLGLICLPGTGHVFQGLLPVWLDVVVTGILWIWFLNLFNFMDGIDGISGAESVAIGVGVALIVVVTSEYDAGGFPLGVTFASVCIGFLLWNWAPAKLFLGDVGSVPLGFLGGWLLLGLAGRGQWAPALILPLYYLVDATGTLALRILKARAPWKAHREHVYQRAVQQGHTHGAVVGRILLGNSGLILLALLSVKFPWVGLCLSAVLVVALIVLLLRHPRAAIPSP